MTCSSDKLYSFERNSFLVVALSLLHGNVNLLLRALIYFRNFLGKDTLTNAAIQFLLEI